MLTDILMKGKFNPMENALHVKAEDIINFKAKVRKVETDSLVINGMQEMKKDVIDR